MINVVVYRRVKGQTMFLEVMLPNCHELTPEAARDALQVAFGGRYGGTVWWERPGGRGGFGFKLYPNSYKKIHNL